MINPLGSERPRQQTQFIRQLQMTKVTDSDYKVSVARSYRVSWLFQCVAIKCPSRVKTGKLLTRADVFRLAVRSRHWLHGPRPRFPIVGADEFTGALCWVDRTGGEF
jgi:hypothetical protein